MTTGREQSRLNLFREGMGVSDQETKEIAELQQQVKTLFNTVGELKSDVKEIKEQLANRLPLWATTIIGILTGVCGFLAARVV